MRIRNSVKPLIIAKNEACYVMDCLCHNIHNAAHQGCPAFTSATHFEIEDFCVDMFYHFDNRTKRKCVLKIYYQFCDHGYREILKNINVQCLRLGNAFKDPRTSVSVYQLQIYCYNVKTHGFI